MRWCGPLDLVQLAIRARNRLAFMKAATPQSSDNSSNARIRSRGKEMIAAASPMLAIETLSSAIHAAPSFSQAIVNLLSKFGQARLIIPLLAGKLESLSSRKIRSLP